MSGVELDCESEVKLRAPLVVEPELSFLADGRAKCRLSLPKKRSGKGEINSKVFWIQVMLFDKLAEQAAKIPMGSMVVVVCRINVNSWYDKKDIEAHIPLDRVRVHTSHNYIAFRVGSQHKGIDQPIEWLPGGKREKKKNGKAEQVPSEETGYSGEDEGMPSDAEVADPALASSGVLDFAFGKKEAQPGKQTSLSDIPGFC